MAGKLNKPVTIVMAMIALAASAAQADRAQNYVLRAAPAPAGVKIDGSVSLWDRSGGIFLCKDLIKEKNTFSAWCYAMYDPQWLYLAFTIRDATPMVNAVDPATNPDKGWGGDCVQLRFKASGDASGEIVYLDAWNYSVKNTPSVQISYPDLAKGGEYRPRINAIESGAECMFQRDANGAGYSLTMRVPWSMLLAAGQSHKAGDSYRMGIEVVWGGDNGGREVNRVVDLVAQKGVSTKAFYDRPQAWGKIALEAKGSLPKHNWEVVKDSDMQTPAQPGQGQPKAAAAKGLQGWPEGVERIQYKSSADATEQPALFYAPATKEPVPLLVGLHSWSTAYDDGGNLGYANWCANRGWVMILPNFRGPNNNPKATGSELVVQDILDAVEYAKSRAHNVDPKRIYLVGASGGGYTALLMAGRAPKVWAGVSAWVPISDLKAWQEECVQAKQHYAGMIEASCGGPPGKSPQVDEQYAKRSPVTYLAAAGDLPLDINTGIHDGHGGSVPVSHALLAFNRVAKEADRIAPADIQSMVKDQAVPAALKADQADPDYASNPVLMRRVSGKARVTVFEGGHEIVVDAAMHWLAKQKKE